MRNEILKILWLGAVTLCSNAFSMGYNIRINNHLQQPIELSRVAAAELKPRTIEIVSFSNRKSSYCFDKKTLNAEESLDLAIDARPYFKDEGENLDSIVLTLNGEAVNCSLKKMEGHILVYPTLSSDNIPRWIQKHTFSDGCTCVLTKDRYGPDFTLTIRGTPNNSTVGSNSSSSSQGSQ